MRRRPTPPVVIAIAVAVMVSGSPWVRCGAFILPGQDRAWRGEGLALASVVAGISKTETASNG